MTERQLSADSSFPYDAEDSKETSHFASVVGGKGVKIPYLTQATLNVSYVNLNVILKTAGGAGGGIKNNNSPAL